jgi:Protein of unknown function (DUF2846)
MKAAWQVVLGSLVLVLSAYRLPAPVIEEATPAPNVARKARPEATASTKPKPKGDDTDKTRESKNARGSARVFVYRPAAAGSWIILTNATISIDNADSFNVANPRYTMKTLSPGKHIFEITGGVVTHQRIPIEIDLRSGQDYYLRATLNMWGFPEGKLIFTRIPNAEGAKEVAKLKQG